MKNFLFVILMIFISCSSKEIEDKNYLDSTQKEIIKSEYYSDSLLNELEIKNYSTQNELLEVEKTSKAPALERVIVKETVKEKIEVDSANFALYCNSVMKINKIYNVFGIFGKESLDSLKKNVEKIIEEHSTEEVNLDESNYTSENIIYYEKIQLKLIDPSGGDFLITPIHLNSIQVIRNNKVSEKWHWKVKPLKINSNSQLLLKLIIFDENMQIDETLSKTYTINIKNNSKHYLSQLFNYINKNPEWLLTTIIIPLIIFLYKRIKKFKKNLKNLKRNH